MATLAMVFIFVSKVVMIGCYYIAPLLIPLWMWQYLSSQKRAEEMAKKQEKVPLAPIVSAEITENLEKA